MADRHVGLRIRERRVQLGQSLEQLAAALGVTAQQARKYETGRNGVPAGRLPTLAAALRVPIGWLFEGRPTEGPAERPAESYVPELPTRPRMLMDIVRQFDCIADAARREALCEAARALAAAGARADG